MNNKKDFKDLIFLDTETTGIGLEDRLFQVAYKINGEEKNELFKPSLEISVEAMETTHITNKDVQNKKSFIGSKMKKDLEKIFSDSKTIFVAHNAQFDIKMLEKEGLEIGKYIDTLKVAQYLDTEAKIPYYRLQYLRYFLDLEVGDAPAHDALGDIRVLEVLFFRLYDKMLEDFQSSEKVLEKMIQISQDPVLIKRINFGKHKGRLIEDLAKTEKSYLEWLMREKQKDASEGNIDEDWIYTLKYYLK